MKKWMVFLLSLCLLLSGCGGSGGAVYVQSVEALSNMGGIAPGDHFLGLVVSQHVSEIKKDCDKAVKELLVKEGDNVKKDQELFRYDTDELQLNYDKKCLELDQLKASIESYKSQIRQWRMNGPVSPVRKSSGIPWRSSPPSWTRKKQN